MPEFSFSRFYVTVFKEKKEKKIENTHSISLVSREIENFQFSFNFDIGELQQLPKKPVALNFFLFF